MPEFGAARTLFCNLCDLYCRVRRLDSGFKVLLGKNRANPAFKLCFETLSSK